MNGWLGRSSCTLDPVPAWRSRHRSKRRSRFLGCQCEIIVLDICYFPENWVRAVADLEAITTRGRGVLPCFFLLIPQLCEVLFRQSEDPPSSCVTARWLECTGNGLASDTSGVIAEASILLGSDCKVAACNAHSDSLFCLSPQHTLSL